MNLLQSSRSSPELISFSAECEFWLSFGVTATILWLLSRTESMSPFGRVVIIQSGAAVVGGSQRILFR